MGPTHREKGGFLLTLKGVLTLSESYFCYLGAHAKFMLEKVVAQREREREEMKGKTIKSGHYVLPAHALGL